MTPRSTVVSLTPSDRRGPVRTCAGCGQRAPQQELTRVVAIETADGFRIVTDPTRRAHGRGAYLHPDTACLERAIRRRALQHRLRIPRGTQTDISLDAVECRSDAPVRGTDMAE